MSTPTPNQLSRVVKGRVISGQELKEYAERHGLCTICGQYQTHERKGTWLKSKFEPMTVINNQGMVTVYKGHCIQPTCYPSVDFVKELLGEIAPKKRIQPRPGGGTMPHRPAPQPPDVSPYASSSGARRSQEAPHHRLPGGHQRGAASDTSGSGGSGHHPNSAMSSSHPSPGAPSNSSPSSSRYHNNNHNNHNNNHKQPYHHRPSDESRSQLDSSGRYQHHRQGNEIAFNPSTAGRFHHQQQPDLNGSGSQFNGSNSAFDPLPTELSTAPTQKSDDFRHLMKHNLNNNNDSNSQHTPNTTEDEKYSSEEGITDPELEALDAQLADGDYIGFLNRLDDPALQQYIALDGLGLFRRWVIRDQMEKPDGVVLGFDGWVKTVKTLVEHRFPTDRDVTIAGLSTLLTLSTLSGNYKKYMIKKRVIDMLIKLIDECTDTDDAEIVNLSCATFASLCSSEKEGLSARYEASSNAIRKLVQVVGENEKGYGREYSILALSHLANHRKKAPATNKTLANYIRERLLEVDNWIGAITGIVKNPNSNRKIAEAGMSLFWRLSFPKEEEEASIPVNVDLLETTLYALQNFDDIGAQQACCGLIANLALNKKFPPDQAPELTKVICAVLSQPTVDEGLAVCGVHAICNLLSNETIKWRVVPEPAIVPATLSTMKKFPACEDLIEFGSLIIAQVTRDDIKMKEKVVRNGGFDLVHRALEHYVMLRGDEPSLVIKDAALCALAAMSGCGAGAQELARSGLLDDMRAMFAVENDDDFKSILQAILQNSQMAQSNGGGIGGGYGSSRRGTLSNNPNAFAKLLGSAMSENQVYDLFEELQELGERGLPALMDHGFDALLTTMSKFRDASLIQEKGCIILAQAYFYLPFVAINRSVQLPNGGWAVVHKVEAFEVVHRAMNTHRRDPSVQHNGCGAIYNFLSSVYGNEQATREISRWTRPFFKEAHDAIANNPADDSVVKRGLSLFQVLSKMHDQGDLRQWGLSILQIVFDALNQFTDDMELREVCFDILLEFKNDMTCLEFIGNSGGVNLFISMLNSEDMDLVRDASQMLASLLKKVFTANSQVARVPHVARTLVECMASHQGDPCIQLNVCSIFEALFNFGDFPAIDRGMEDRMVRVLSDSLALAQSNADLTEKACRVLALIIPSMEPEAIDSMRNVLGPTFTRVLEQNMEHPEVEAAVMDALWICCDKHDFFKHTLLHENSLRTIVQAMSLHLGSFELQRSGCSLLWMLSGYGHGRQIIGNFGGVESVVNAMLAHNQSTVVQKEGLTVLKNLATASTNKERITSTGGEDAVKYALWIHYREPQVISVALSALNNIAVDSETKSVAVMRDGVLDIVIGAMKRFPREDSVQKNACFYLKSCSYSRANLAQMSQKYTELEFVLRRAATTFPEACQSRASSILQKVEQFR